MATTVERIGDDCRICLRSYTLDNDIRKPIVGVCGHSWCKSCDKKLWKMTAVTKNFSCPVCKRHLKKGNRMTPNFALIDLLKMSRKYRAVVKRTKKKSERLESELAKASKTVEMYNKNPKCNDCGFPMKIENSFFHVLVEKDIFYPDMIQTSDNIKDVARDYICGGCIRSYKNEGLDGKHPISYRRWKVIMEHKALIRSINVLILERSKRFSITGLSEVYKTTFESLCAIKDKYLTKRERQNRQSIVLRNLKLAHFTHCENDDVNFSSFQETVAYVVSCNKNIQSGGIGIKPNETFQEMLQQIPQATLIDLSRDEEKDAENDVNMEGDEEIKESEDEYDGEIEEPDNEEVGDQRDDDTVLFNFVGNVPAPVQPPVNPRIQGVHDIWADINRQAQERLERFRRTLNIRRDESSDEDDVIEEAMRQLPRQMDPLLAPENLLRIPPPRVRPLPRFLQHQLNAPEPLRGNPQHVRRLGEAAVFRLRRRRQPENEQPQNPRDDVIMVYRDDDDLDQQQRNEQQQPNLPQLALAIVRQQIEQQREILDRFVPPQVLAVPENPQQPDAPPADAPQQDEAQGNGRRPRRPRRRAAPRLNSAVTPRYLLRSRNSNRN